MEQYIVVDEKNWMMGEPRLETNVTTLATFKTRGLAILYIENHIPKTERKSVAIEKWVDGEFVKRFSWLNGYRDKYSIFYDKASDRIQEKGVYLQVFFQNPGFTLFGTNGKVEKRDGWDIVNSVYRQKPQKITDFDGNEYVLEQFDITYPSAWAPYKIKQQLGVKTI